MDVVVVPASRSTLTYRYLRLAIVLLALFLGTAVAIEAWWGDSPAQASISAYYYTPVRGVFVATLVAMALGLIAIQGRDWGYEDVLLNFSGMLAPVVALVPTPILGTDALPCPADYAADEKCVPLAFQDGVANNVWALFVLAVGSIAVAAVVTRPSRRTGVTWRRWLVGYVLAALLVVATLVVFATDRELFLRWAHYAAAVPMFGLLVAVGVVNGLATDHTRSPGRQPPRIPGVTEHLRAWYFGLAVAMSLVVGLAVGYGLLFGEDGGWTAWLFWVEVALLVMFSLFWTLQTIDFWNEGLPPPEGASMGT